MSKTDHKYFQSRNRKLAKLMAKDRDLLNLSRRWLIQSCKYEYSYHFSWLGLPIIQYPQDILAVQELIWRVKPNLVVETGIARGGSLILFASILELIGEKGKVIGIDIDIRKHNRNAIERHVLSRRIKLLEGSSIDSAMVAAVTKEAISKKIMVLLDSNHTHEHVLKELNLYSPLITKGSYIVVFDTVIEDMPDNFFLGRPWGKGNNPKTAVEEFLKTNDRFEIDKEIANKLLITVAPNGYLKCIKD